MADPDALFFAVAGACAGVLAGSLAMVWLPTCFDPPGHFKRIVMGRAQRAWFLVAGLTLWLGCASLFCWWRASEGTSRVFARPHPRVLEIQRRLQARPEALP